MTSKDYLSQEEIDALLRQASEAEPASKDAQEETLDPVEEDAIGEIGNITFGSAATALSTLLGKKVDITTPKVSIIRREDLETEFPKPHVAVHVQYVEGFQGINSLVIKTKDARIIADLMLGGNGEVKDEEELNEIHVSAVQEAMNQMMGSSATSMSTIFNRLVNISPPSVNILDVMKGDGVSSLPPVDVFVKISFRLTIGDLIDSTIMQLLPVPFVKELVRNLIGGDPAAQTSQPAAAPAPSASQEPSHAEPQAASHQGYAQEQPPQQPYMQPPQQQQPYMQPPIAPPPGPQTYGSVPTRGVNVQPVQFPNIGGAPYVQADGTNLNLLLDIPLKVTVELGRTSKQIKEILELSQGSVIELDKLAGEPVDILVNNKLIAKGEVVVIDENFGVRVTEIVSQWDRIQKLQ
ncbi:MAG: flagellar motor switch phosphatase FliY [Thermobacillus sp.]|uniref:flagellar motor switch phosphatase FliY n=1 Tax=Thermobacillus sp. TaxID=2108467 RepID=UPI000E39376F|nr:flagellar motor switch phosphatase FliY [Thermobacillus sp.]REK57909.1 MAG: flagellar motor switch phosphatase FliY [Thermobacillus sp.]